MNRVVAAVVVAWAAAAWGGRITLLTGPEGSDPVTWLRIGGSLLAALAAAWALWVGRSPWLVWLYAGWALAVWTGSLWSVWTGPHETGFRLVHTGLAIVSLGVAAAAVAVSGR